MTTTTDTIDLPTHALTIRDPWAQAIVWGDKRVENRTRRPPEKLIGKRVAVHCGKTVDEDAALDIQGNSFLSPLRRHRQTIIDAANETGCPATIGYRHHPGCIIGDARIVGVYDSTFKEKGSLDLVIGSAWDLETTGAIKGRILDSPWWAGPVGYLLDDVRAYETPIAVRGQVYPFEIPEDVRAQLRPVEVAR